MEKLKQTLLEKGIDITLPKEFINNCDVTCYYYQLLLENLKSINLDKEIILRQQDILALQLKIQLIQLEIQLKMTTPP